MSNKNLTVGLIAVAIIAVLGLFLPQAKHVAGAILDTSYFDTFQASTSGGFNVGSNTVINGSRQATFAGITSTGNVTVSTSNTATSSITVGCVQSYATSTLTPVKLTASSTSVGPTGIAYWQFGTCP